MVLTFILFIHDIGKSPKNTNTIHRYMKWKYQITYNQWKQIQRNNQQLDWKYQCTQIIDCCVVAYQHSKKNNFL